MFVNITDTIDAKINAMKTYGGESRSFPHPRSTDALMSLGTITNILNSHYNSTKQYDFLVRSLFFMEVWNKNRMGCKDT